MGDNKLVEINSTVILPSGDFLGMLFFSYMKRGGWKVKVLIAMDSFKGSISSIEAGKAVASGIKHVFPNAKTIVLPLADGGEGTVESLVYATHGQIINIQVTGPLNEKVRSSYGILGDGKTAVIEIAAACGLTLLSEEKRNPAITTTFGVGELIVDAINRGCRDFVIGLGGSATNDAGVGMLQALGYRFLNKQNQEIGMGGHALIHIEKIDKSNVHPELKSCTFHVACDVNNPLYGPNGAAYIYGPQKGADHKMVAELDKGLQHFAGVMHRQFGMNIHNIAGAGAAGGLGAAFAGFLNGKLQSGIQLVLETLQIERHMGNTDFVITGEGRLDAQTSMGKAPSGIAKLAEKYHIPVIALAGGVSNDSLALNNIGITSYFSILNEPMVLEYAMNPEKTYENLQSTSRQIFRLIHSIMTRGNR